VRSSFLGYNSSFWNRANTHRIHGFQALVFEDELPRGRVLAMGLADDVVFPAVAEHLAGLRSPFYGFVLSLSLHHPYNDVPPEYEDRFPRVCVDEAGLSFRGYLQLSSYVDRQLELFFHRMVELGIAENTLFVFFGDHDLGSLSAGGSRDAYAHLNRLLRFCFGKNPLSPEEHRMPLCIVAPGLEDDLAPHVEKYSRVVGCSSDLFPTIFHLLGLPIPAHCQGMHLFQNGPRLVTMAPYHDHASQRVFDTCVTDQGVYLLDPVEWKASQRRGFDGEARLVTSHEEYDRVRQAADSRRRTAAYLRSHGHALVR
jgi:phosphoglycerol transferase MdoB-like AlkP superfamily enzyme